MNEPIVRCEGVKKRYGSSLAVADLKLAVQRGEILALLGPSGCGKTTSLRLIAGFERADAGCIEIDGRVVNSDTVLVPPEKRKLGMVFQNFALFPHLNVEQNIAYGLNGSRDRAVRVSEVLELVGLRGMQARMPHELSGGQQQRVALARALAPAPAVILLDEPFSGLDAGLREQLRGDVARILRASGATVVFVTHNQEEALFMGDRIAVMNAGSIEQIGAPHEVFGAPATRFVAEFMGETDFMPGTVHADAVETELGMLPIRLPARQGALVELVLRPDDVRIEENPDGTATVTEKHYRGVMNLYAVELASGQVLHSFGEHTVNLAPGTRVQVSLTGNHAPAYFALG